MQISLVTEEIRSASQRLRTEGQNMESAVQTADNAVSPLRDFQSPRLVRDLETWDSLKTSFRSALEQLLQAADELVAAAEANEAANR